MHIVFGEAVQNLPDSFTVLELDSFVSDTGVIRTAWCVVENVPLGDFPILSNLVETHQNLMSAYKKQNWEYCSSAIKTLLGKWNSELDSFYFDLQQRVSEKANSDFDADWSAVRSHL
jgi:hypothetical protein